MFESNNPNNKLSSKWHLWTLINKLITDFNEKVPFKDDEVNNLLSKIILPLDLDISKIKKNPDLLDEIYENTIPKRDRKQFGQFLTPPRVARLMVEWGLKEGQINVMDPSIGTGIFMSEAFKINNKVNFTGLDIDPIMLNISFARSLILGKKPNLFLHNFLTYFNNERFDFIICNPPYMKFHDFDNKKMISEIEGKYNLELSKLTNIYSLFFIHASSFLKNDGKMAFITPSEFLATNYGVELKKFLVDNFSIEAIISADSNKMLFNDALTSSVITFLTKKKPDLNHQTKFIRISDWKDNKPIFDAINFSKESENVSVNLVFQTELNPSNKWLTLFEKPIEVSIKGLVPLKEIAKIKRGIATGCNEFFTLSKDEIKRWGVEEKFLRPVLSNARHGGNYVITKKDFEKLKDSNEKVNLLYCFEKPSPNLERYIEYGKDLNVDKRYLLSKRNPWYSMEKREIAPILATVFSRDKMRFVLNEAEVLNLAAFHSIYPNFKEPDKIKALLAYLNSGVCKKMINIQKRTYGGGLDKLEPSDLGKVLVIDINKINDKLILKLSTLFDKLCKSDWIEREKIKEDIDTILEDNLSQIKSIS